MPAPRPKNERERLEALAKYRILDTPPEFAYDAITELAAEICGCPAAIMGFVEDTREWLKSKYGLPAEITEVPRDITVCATTLCMNDLLYVSDLTKDARFKDLGTVAGPPHVRFYCGMPLINSEGYALGTLCIVDFEPRELTPAQRESVRRLSQQAVAQLELRRQLLERDAVLKELDETRTAVDAERRKSDRLLHLMFPDSIAAELKDGQQVQPRYYESATILLADFKSFTQLTEGLDPAGLVKELNQHFSRFDDIAVQNRLEKLKTIGDAYLCAGGLPEANRTHALDACLAALQFQASLVRYNQQRERLRLPRWDLRIGINTGPVVAGVVGKHKFTYDIWGDAVNVTQRLEAACEPGRINVSGSTYHRIQSLFECEPRGRLEVKSKGAIDMYFVVRIRPEYSADPSGAVPNERFWSAAGVPAPAARA
jgi:class 3 adenylate cyclase